MCGRYQFSTEESETLRDILREAQRGAALEARAGEIFPTNPSAVLTWKNGGCIPQVYKWGFPKFRGPGVVINARAETVLEKPMFRHSMERSRCAVPTSGFFEWDGNKQKYLFRMPGQTELYLAGIYNVFQGTPCFVILTTEANESVAGVHTRMPVIVPKDRLQSWTGDSGAAVELLKSTPPPLDKTAV